MREVGRATGRRGPGPTGAPGTPHVVLALLLVPVLVACSTQPRPDPAILVELDELETRIWGERDPSGGLGRLREAEQLVAACMAEAGFVYHPQVPDAPPGHPAPDVLTPEHAAEVGYGETIPPAPGVVPNAWARRLGPVAGEQENLDYRAGLSPEALAEYWAALDGAAQHDGAAPQDAPGAAPHAGGASQDGAGAGCRPTAMGQVFADVVVPEEFRAAETALRQSRVAVEADARLEAATAQWRACMAEAGHPGLDGHDGGRDLVVPRAAELPAPADMAFEQVAETFPTELAELQAFERAVATADAECLQLAGVYAARDAARAEIQGLVLETFRADLEAWAAWAQEQRGAHE